MMSRFDRDVLDFFGRYDGADCASAPAAKHALVFGRMWRALFGYTPSGSVHDAYCAGVLPAGAAVDQARFARFVAGEMSLPVVCGCDESAFAESLNDPDTLRRQLVAKLVDRYAGDDRFSGMSVREAHAALLDESKDCAMALDHNPMTGHYVGPDSTPHVPCAKEAWRVVCGRDALLHAQARNGMCLFVESSEDVDVESCAAVANEMSAVNGFPVVIMSDCPNALSAVSAKCVYYHHAYRVPCPEAYSALPVLFRAFVLVGGDGRRPPLCREASRCWHYASRAPALETAYTPVTDTVAHCFCPGRTVYYVPRLQTTRSGQKAYALGVHPDTADLVTDIENVPVVRPEDSGKCEVYVSCVSQEGVERCMAAGGVAVCADHYAIDDGINGFLSRDASKPSVRTAVQRAATCDRRVVGESASRVVLLIGKETHGWLWRGLLSGADATKSKKPADAAVLHQRFLIVSATVRYREITRYRSANVARRAVVFVDSRPDPGTALSVLLTLCSLRAGWTIVGLVTGESRPYYEGVMKPLGDVRFIEMAGFSGKNYFIEQYNERMKRLDTWLEIAAHADTALTVQSDGLIVRKGLEEHEAMGRDYCGAPWLDHPYLRSATAGNLVGNGGVSLRSVRAMLDVCRTKSRERLSVYALAPHMSEAEDVYFSRHVKNPCPRESARAFSMEQLPDTGALGYHRFWMYHPVEFTERYFAGVLGEKCEPVPSVEPNRWLQRRGKTVL